MAASSRPASSAAARPAHSVVGVLHRPGRSSPTRALGAGAICCRGLSEMLRAAEDGRDRAEEGRVGRSGSPPIHQADSAAVSGTLATAGGGAVADGGRGDGRVAADVGRGAGGFAIGAAADASIDATSSALLPSASDRPKRLDAAPSGRRVRST